MLAAGPIGCTPIPAPPAEDGPLDVGDVMPTLQLRASDGAIATFPGTSDGPLLITLLRPYEDTRAAIGRDLMEKLERARRVLRPELEVRTGFRVLLLDDPGDRAPAGWVRPSSAWRVIVGPEGELRELATRLRVLVWNGEGELPGQTFMTLVVDREGVIRAKLPGVDGWSARDLVGTIVAASDPRP